MPILVEGIAFAMNLLEMPFDTSKQMPFDTSITLKSDSIFLTILLAGWERIFLTISNKSIVEGVIREKLVQVCRNIHHVYVCYFGVVCYDVDSGAIQGMLTYFHNAFDVTNGAGTSLDWGRDCMSFVCNPLSAVLTSSLIVAF